MPPQLPRASCCPSRTSLSPFPPARHGARLNVSSSQKRHATLLRRPLRPYTFTQLVTLTDGSVAIQRTTSPTPVYKSIKDTRNHPMWNPSSQRLANLEEDEAGRLRAFRKRFGRGWDAEVAKEERHKDEQLEQAKLGKKGAAASSDAAEMAHFEQEGDLMDLISGFEAPSGAATSGGGAAASVAPKDKKPAKGSGKAKK